PRLSAKAGRCRRGRAGAAGPGGRDAAAAGGPDVGRPGALGTHSADLRIVRPQRLGNGTAAEDASPHLAADPEQARPAQLTQHPIGLSRLSDPSWPGLTRPFLRSAGRAPRMTKSGAARTSAA